MARLILLLSSLLVGCTPAPGAAAGRLIDARTDAPIAGAVVRLSTSTEGCPPTDVPSDGDGRFAATLACGGATYTAAPADPSWYLAEPSSVNLETELRVWRAPPDPGVYLLTGTTLTPLLSHTVVDSVFALGTEEIIRFPVEIPGVLPRITGDTLLLDVGAVLGGSPRFEPLVASPEKRRFGTLAAPESIDPWFYLSVQFVDDTTFERVEVTPEPHGILRVAGERTLRYTQADALPPGRYAILNSSRSRAFLLDFGDLQAAP